MHNRYLKDVRVSRRLTTASRLRHTGITLIELMIVVTIVAILGAIAYPAYENQVRKSYRADAQSDLMELASFMERFFTENNRYDEDLDGNDVVLPFDKTPRSGTARYTLRFFNNVDPTATTFRLEALALSVGGQDADSCGNMTIDQAGAKWNSTSDAKCWR